MIAKEIVGSFLTIISVIALAKGKTSGWIYSIMGCLIYSMIFIEEKLYVNFILQLVFIAQGIIGLYYWKKQVPDNLPFISRNMNGAHTRTLLVITLGISFFVIPFMNYFTDNKSPMLDTILSIGSIIATALLIKRFKEAWFLWMAIDIGYIYLFISIGLWVSASLYFILFLICVQGYKEWNKTHAITVTT